MKICKSIHCVWITLHTVFDLFFKPLSENILLCYFINVNLFRQFFFLQSIHSCLVSADNHTFVTWRHISAKSGLTVRVRVKYVIGISITVLVQHHLNLKANDGYKFKCSIYLIIMIVMCQMCQSVAFSWIGLWISVCVYCTCVCVPLWPVGNTFCH